MTKLDRGKRYRLLGRARVVVTDSGRLEVWARDEEEAVDKVIEAMLEEHGEVGEVDVTVEEVKE